MQKKIYNLEVDIGCRKIKYGDIIEVESGWLMKILSETNEKNVFNVIVNIKEFDDWISNPDNVRDDGTICTTHLIQKAKIALI